MEFKTKLVLLLVVSLAIPLASAHPCEVQFAKALKEEISKRPAKAIGMFSVVPLKVAFGERKLMRRVIVKELSKGKIMKTLPRGITAKEQQLFPMVRQLKRK